MKVDIHIWLQTVYANITKNNKKVGQIFDFNHMIENIKNCRKNIEVKGIKYNDVIVFKDITIKQKFFISKKLNLLNILKNL